MLKDKFQLEFASTRLLAGHGIFVKHKVMKELLSGYSRQRVFNLHLIDEADMRGVVADARL